MIDDGARTTTVEERMPGPTALDGSRPPTRYPTVVAPVEEVSLVAIAPRAVWEEPIRAAGVHPFLVTPDDVELRFLACRTRYMGIRFAEVSLSVAVSHDEAGTGRDGVFLATAFNSVRFFAWVERTMFSTPYAHAEVELAAGAHPRIAVHIAGADVLDIAAGAGTRETLPGDGGWEGPIYLPPATSGRTRWFFGRLRGPSLVLPFDAGADRLGVQPRGGDDPLARLKAGCRPTHWQVRTGAEHARTRTTTQATR